MAEKSELFCSAEARDLHVVSSHEDTQSRRDLLEIAIVLSLILIAVWTPQGKLNAVVSIVAAACVVAFAIAGRRGAEQLGLTRPLAGTTFMLLAGAILCGVVLLIGLLLRFVGPVYHVPLSRSWQYATWALQQEFILQSIFFALKLFWARDGPLLQPHLCSRWCTCRARFSLHLHFAVEFCFANSSAGSEISIRLGLFTPHLDLLSPPAFLTNGCTTCAWDSVT
jgi:hypothetical protein